MPRPRTLPNEFPEDWDSKDCLLHGFSKMGRTRSYHPVLCLNGSQVYFGPCPTRQLAAEAYDVLLRFFIAFTPSRAMPNFPAAFFSIERDTALTFAGAGVLTSSKLLTIETRLIEEFQKLSRSESDYRSDREKEIRAAISAPDPMIAALKSERRRAVSRLDRFTFTASTFKPSALLRQLNLRADNTTRKLVWERIAQVESTQKDLLDQLTTLLEDINAALDCDPV